MSISKTVSFSAYHGVQISATQFGDDHAPPVLLLHGAGQTRHSWRETASHLADAGWRAIALDTRGHGNSDWAADGDYSIDSLLADLRLIVESLRKNSATKPAVVGASLGGITSLIAEGESAQGLFSALVLVDITPTISRKGVEKILEFMRRHSDGFSSLEDVRLALAAYQPHRKVRDNGTTGLEKNLRRGPDDRFYWHWDPKLLDHVSRFDTELVQRQQQACGGLGLPVLLVHGRMSEIVSDDTAREFLQLVPGARYVNVKDAAHMVAGDDNDLFSSSVIDFLHEQLGETCPAGRSQ